MPTDKLCWPESLTKLEKDIAQANNEHSQALLICIWMDIVSTYYAGKITLNGQAKRFKKALINLAGVTTHNAELIYQLRSSMVHFYGAGGFSGNNNCMYRFILAETASGILSIGNTCYQIAPGYLKDVLEKMKHNFWQSLLQDAFILKKFNSVSRLIGSYPKTNNL